MNKSLLMELVTYNKDDGKFFWNVRPRDHFNSDRDHKIWNTKHSLSEIRNPDKRGYLYLNLNGKRYPLHKLAWLYVYGHYPNVVDHKNRKVDDNRVENLRVASNSDNVRNQSLKKSNTSGFKGVHFSKQKNKWVANIRTDTGRIHLGCFVCKLEAAKAYDKAAYKYHGEFAMTNKDLGLYE